MFWNIGTIIGHANERVSTGTTGRIVKFSVCFRFFQRIRSDIPFCDTMYRQTQAFMLLVRDFELAEAYSRRPCHQDIRLLLAGKFQGHERALRAPLLFPLLLAVCVNVAVAVARTIALFPVNLIVRARPTRAPIPARLRASRSLSLPLVFPLPCAINEGNFIGVAPKMQ